MGNFTTKRRRHCGLRSNLSTFLCTVLLLLFPGIGMAQSRTITGEVVDQNGNPVIGATVMIEGTAQGVMSGGDGSFTLTKVPESGSITASFMGYVSQTLSVQGRNIFRFVLQEDAIGLDEVVVVGYGTQRKADVTGALTSVSAKDIQARPVSNALQAMQGKMAGVDITSNERPGELGKIRIRGERSFSVDGQPDRNAPLYVIDGIPVMSASDIETLNPRDIETIDVLKDASATAIYGSRGANGVILVTTKKGRAGRFTLNYSGTVTIEDIYTKAPMMSASEYITWRRWAAYNQGVRTGTNEYQRGDEPTLENDKLVFGRTYGGDPTAWTNILRGWENGSWDGSKVQNTDWTDFVTQTSIVHEHTLSASGGTEKVQAYGSFGYLNNRGTMKGQTYERYTAKTTVDITPKSWFRMGGSINATWSDQDFQS